MSISDADKKQIQELADQAVAVLMIGVKAAEQLFEGLLEESALAEKYAKLFRKNVDALKAEGFSEDAAVAIATNFLGKITSMSDKS